MVEQRFISRLLFDQYLMIAYVAGMKGRRETAGLISALLKPMIFRSVLIPKSMVLTLTLYYFRRSCKGEQQFLRQSLLLRKLASLGNLAKHFCALIQLSSCLTKVISVLCSKDKCCAFKKYKEQAGSTGCGNRPGFWARMVHLLAS